MADPVTVTLKEPITFGSETISSLTLHPLKARDMKSLKLGDSGGMEMGDFLGVISSSARQPPSVVDELGVEDLLACVEVITDFLPASLRTGRKS